MQTTIQPSEYRTGAENWHIEVTGD